MSRIFEALQKSSPDTLEELENLGPGPAPSPESQAAPPLAPVPPDDPFEIAASWPEMEVDALDLPIEAPPPDRSPIGIRSLPIAVQAAGPLFPFDASQNYAAEQYKIIRTKIIQHRKQAQLILITSAGSGDGKTVTAINLAASLSLRGDTKVLLIDGDFRRSMIHTQLSLPLSPGFTDILAGRCTPEEAVIHAQQFPNLFVLPAGARFPNTVELLDSASWTGLRGRLREKFSYIVIDSIPVAAVAEYHLLEAVCDGTVLVARPDHTKRSQCLAALETVSKDKLLGVILNCVEDRLFSRDKNYSKYYYSSLQ